MDVSKIIEDTQYAVEHIDENLAKQLLKQIDEFLKNNSDFSLTQKMNDLKVKLKIVDFPDISDADAEQVFRNNVLAFFQLEIPLEERINTRYIFQGRFSQNETRKVLKRAILENREMLGGMTIGQWLQKFDQTYNIDNRTENDILNFLMNNAQAKALSANWRDVLKKILHAYETLLASDLVDIFEAIMIDKSLQKNQGRNSTEAGYNFERNLDNQSRRVGHQRDNQPQSSTPMPRVQMTLQEALKKFEKLGEQSVSGNPIKLKIFETPVRPSIKNWISDYYEKVDARKHDSIERGNYLFHSENARRLTTGERQKVGTMLRALDEDALVAVDPGRQEILFENQESNLLGNQESRIKNQAVENQESGIRRQEFSSNHKFPYERSSVVSPAQRQSARPSGNVVNLRDESGIRN